LLSGSTRNAWFAIDSSTATRYSAGEVKILRHVAVCASNAAFDVLTRGCHIGFVVLEEPIGLARLATNRRDDHAALVERRPVRADDHADGLVTQNLILLAGRHFAVSPLDDGVVRPIDPDPKRPE
jgi:hypothetical protein